MATEASRSLKRWEEECPGDDRVGIARPQLQAVRCGEAGKTRASRSSDQKLMTASISSRAPYSLPLIARASRTSRTSLKRLHNQPISTKSLEGALPAREDRDLDLL